MMRSELLFHRFGAKQIGSELLGHPVSSSSENVTHSMREAFRTLSRTELGTGNVGRPTYTIGHSSHLRTAGSKVSLSTHALLPLGSKTQLLLFVCPYERPFRRFFGSFLSLRELGDLRPRYMGVDGPSANPPSEGITIPLIPLTRGQ
jgi:hypothetical protein